MTSFENLEVNREVEDIRGRWWHKEGEALRCDLCPRKCLIRKGKRGFCYVRQAREDGIYLTTYGRSSGFVIDPIEKKPLNHFYPGTSVLTFGTAGCNLGCRFCQNWDISKARSFDRLQSPAGPEAIAEAAQIHGCRSVAFSYNDPVIFAEYAIDVAKACRERGIKTVAVTAGYIEAEARKEFFQEMDAVNVDLKAFNESFYHDLCLSHLEPVKDTLIYLAQETNVWLEITTLLIPGKNDSPQELEALSTWIATALGDHIPLHLTAFHPDFKLQDVPATPPQVLTDARTIALKAGLKFVYTGNVHDPRGSSTYCSHCHSLLIERDWYVLGRSGLHKDTCMKCGTILPGFFDEKFGTWGPRRQAINIPKS